MWHCISMVFVKLLLPFHQVLQSIVVLQGLPNRCTRTCTYSNFKQRTYTFHSLYVHVNKLPFFLIRVANSRTMIFSIFVRVYVRYILFHSVIHGFSAVASDLPFWIIFLGKLLSRITWRELFSFVIINLPVKCLFRTKV